MLWWLGKGEVAMDSWVVLIFWCLINFFKVLISLWKMVHLLFITSWCRTHSMVVLGYLFTFCVSKFWFKRQPKWMSNEQHEKVTSKSATSKQVEYTDELIIDKLTRFYALKPLFETHHKWSKWSQSGDSRCCSLSENWGGFHGFKLSSVTILLWCLALSTMIYFWTKVILKRYKEGHRIGGGITPERWTSIITYNH